MKKVIVSLLLLLSLSQLSFANVTSYAPVRGNDVSAIYATSITDNTVNHYKSVAVWVGTSQSLDFSFDGVNWITFQGATAGTVIPVQVVGARITSGSAAPNAGDVVFLYNM